MIRLETLFSKCICLSVKGDSWQFWVFIKFLIFLTVNVTDCTEMGECQQKCICLRNQKRNSKSFTGWMIMECEDMCFHNLPWSSALQLPPLYVQCSAHQVFASPTDGTIYHLQSSFRSDLQVCYCIISDATASDAVLVLLPNSQFAAVNLTVLPYEVVYKLLIRGKNSCSILSQNPSRLWQKASPLHFVRHAKLCGLHLFFFFFFNLFSFSELFRLLDKEKSGVVQLSLAEVRLVGLKYHVF